MSFLLVGFCVLSLASSGVHGDRVYYIAAVEEDWDYAPSGVSKATDPTGKIKNFIEHSANRTGSVYRKALYKQYTNDTFSEQVPGPAWMGLIGPILKAEVGETMTVHFRNFATKNFTVHPHGLHYEKHHEGAYYIDKTTGFGKHDDAVPPGGSYTYIWDVVPEFGPAKDDPDCIPWVYHSHGPEVPRDTNSGLIGILLTCRPGSLDEEGNRKDVDKEFVAFLKNFDENGSWYAEDNYNRCGVPALCRGLALERNHDFLESNMMHTLNGYIYANGNPFEACVGDKIGWYIIGMGSESDVHSFVVDGETLKYHSHRREAVGVFATSFVAAEMVLVRPGKKLAYCDTTTHFEDGMQTFIDVKRCNGKSHAYKTSGTTRKHFLAVEEVIWDYAPSGVNRLTKQVLMRTGSDEAVYYEAKSDRIGSQYIKALFYEHTDSTFKREIIRSSEEDHLGFLGPTIRVEVGDVLEVVLFNNATRPFSFLPRGLIPYGDLVENGSLATQTTAPDEKRLYRFYVPEETAPTSSDPPCITFMYHSAVDPVKDVYSGLVGPLLICKKGSLDHEGKQKGVSRELKLFFAEMDENKSWYRDRNIQTFCVSKEVNPRDPLFIESNVMRSINGRGYGNLHGLSICKSERVVWHLMSVGSHTGVHSVYFHDLDFIKDGNREDTVMLFPGASFTFITKASNVGVWEIVCRNINHYKAGMTALYDVSECGYHEPQSIFQRQNKVKRRRYYIGAVEREWNYAPSLVGLIMGDNLLDPKSGSYKFLNTEPGYIGPKYIKALFREFTDTSFRYEKERTPEEEHLGIMGPVIKAEVGDEIEIVFKNLATKPYSIHSHIVKTDKANEGTFYADTADKAAVPPNGLTVYKWQVPTGPGPKDPACISSLYYSAHDQSGDLYSGLLGPIIICRKGILDENGRRKDVEKEFSVLFSIFDENQSLYLSDNIGIYAPSRRNTSDPREPAFVESNLMHAINGYIFQAVPGLTMTVGEKVAWYLLAFGSTNDVHTVHFHGQTILYEHSGEHTQDVIDIFPEHGASLVMLAINPGVWLVHCHVNDHMDGGMETIYTILPKGSYAFVASLLNHRAITGIGEAISSEKSAEPSTATVTVRFKDDKQHVRRRVNDSPEPSSSNSSKNARSRPVIHSNSLESNKTLLAVKHNTDGVDDDVTKSPEQDSADVATTVSYYSSTSEATSNISSESSEQSVFLSDLFKPSQEIDNTKINDYALNDSYSKLSFSQTTTSYISKITKSTTKFSENIFTKRYNSSVEETKANTTQQTGNKENLNKVNETGPPISFLKVTNLSATSISINKEADDAIKPITKIPTANRSEKTQVRDLVRSKVGTNFTLTTNSEEEETLRIVEDLHPR